MFVVVWFHEIECSLWAMHGCKIWDNRSDYWMSTICPAKLWKPHCLRYVSFLKKHHLIVLFTSDAMHKKCKWPAYTSPDLLARFSKVNLSHAKNLVSYFILASLLDKGMQPINYKCVHWLIYCDHEPLWLLTHWRWSQFFSVHTGLKITESRSPVRNIFSLDKTWYWLLKSWILNIFFCPWNIELHWQ